MAPKSSIRIATSCSSVSSAPAFLAFRRPAGRIPVGSHRAQAHVSDRLGLLNTAAPGLIFVAIVLSFVPHDLMYGPQAALIAECFTPRLWYGGCSIGYQLSSVTPEGRRR
jgi:hypothetical protein